MQGQPLFPLFVTLISMLLTGGPNDLLGYISSDAYWKSKHVTVSVDQLAQFLKEPAAVDVSKLIAELSSPDPKVRDKAGARIAKIGAGALPQLRQATSDPDVETASRARALVAQIQDESKALSVRQLMAIRALGELKEPASVPLLRPLIDSKTPFVSQYASQAIALIDGKAAAQTALPVEQRMKDVNLLPAKIDMASQVAPAGNATPMPFDRIIDRMPFVLTAERKQAMIDQANHRLIQIAELLGNARLDCVTLGWWTAPQNQPGYAVLIARGQYDAKSSADALRKADVERKLIQGIEVFMLDDETALLLPDDHVAILVAAETNGELPVAQTIAAFRSGKGEFATNADLARLVQATDVQQPFWIATKVSDGLRQVIEVLNPFDTAILTGTAPGDRSNLQMKLVASGTNAGDVKAAVDAATATAQQYIEQAKPMAQANLPVQSMLTFFQGVKISGEGTGATLTASLSCDQVLVFLKAWHEMRGGGEMSGFWDQ